jgi:hypothetical protein
MVEHKGFEPLTSSMPWKRASQLRQCPSSEQRYYTEFNLLILVMATMAYTSFHQKAVDWDCQDEGDCQ